MAEQAESLLPIGSVTELTGSVTATGEAQAPRVLAVGDIVLDGDSVATGIDSGATFLFSNGSELNLGPEATALLDAEVHDASAEDDPRDDSVVDAPLIQDLLGRDSAAVGLSDIMAETIVIRAEDVDGEAEELFGFSETDAENSQRIDISDILDAAGYDKGAHNIEDFINVAVIGNGDVSIGVDMTGAGADYTRVLLLHPEAHHASSGTDDLLQKLLADGVLIIS